MSDSYRCRMLMVDDSTCKLGRGHAEPCQSDSITNLPPGAARVECDCGRCGPQS